MNAKTEASDMPQHRRTRADGESSLLRMLSVMELFTLDKPAWTVEQIADAMQLTQSTAYRYVAALSSFGYLALSSGAEYSLGPKIVELDLLIRQTDPLITQAQQKAVELLELVPEGVVSLINLHGDTAISVFQIKKPDDLEISNERGRSMKLYAGAAAKAILAYLPRSRLLKIYGNHHAEIKGYGLGETWKEFSSALLAIRKAATIITKGEVNPDSWGVAAPVFNSNGDIKGSLNLIMPIRTYEGCDHAALADLLLKAAQSLNAPTGEHYADLAVK